VRAITSIYLSKKKKNKFAMQTIWTAGSRHTMGDMKEMKLTGGHTGSNECSVGLYSSRRVHGARSILVVNRLRIVKPKEMWNEQYDSS
jgi:hypothetical protein